jgi:hypothetical protein
MRANAIAMTTLDLLTDKHLLAKAKEYFANVSTKDQKYLPMLALTDRPSVELNAETMSRYKEELKSTTTTPRATAPISNSSASSFRRCRSPLPNAAANLHARSSEGCVRSRT